MDLISRTMLLGASSGPSGVGPHWIVTLGAAGSEQGNDITVDSSGNVYVCGQTSSQGAGQQDALFAKYDTLGTIQWQRSLGGTSADTATGIAIDSSGNVYIIGNTSSQGAGGTDILLAKYNSSGTIQWQRSLGGASEDSGGGISVDSSANIYISGVTSSQGAGNQDMIIAKYNTSGVIQWQRSLGSTSFEVGGRVATDSSGNLYISGRSNLQGSDDTIIAKYNTSGVLQWQRTLIRSGSDLGQSITIDSSNNVYVTMSNFTVGSMIVKYNDSGVIQWQRNLTSNSPSFRDVAVDSLGYIYIGGTATISSKNAMLAVKYSPSGELLWGRTFTGPGINGVLGRGIEVDDSGNYYLSGWTDSQGAGGADVLITKLPGDGSFTGTYDNLTYSITSFTNSTGTATETESTLTDAARTLTDAARTLTSGTRTLTSAIIAVP